MPTGSRALFVRRPVLAVLLTLFAIPALAQTGWSGDPDAPKAANSQSIYRDAPAARARWFMRGRSVKGESSALLLQRAFRQKMKMRQSALEQFQQQLQAIQGGGATSATTATTQTASLLSMPAWQSLGPAPLSGEAYGNVSGRITAIAVDPCDTTGNTVYVGGAYGGLWRSTNATNADPTTVTWTPLYDTDAAAATLTVGAITLGGSCSGTLSQVILVGTGEPNNAGDSYYGMGIMRSADGGSTWSLISTANAGARSLRGIGFARFAWSSSSFVVAAGAVTSIGNEFNLVGLSASGSDFYWSSDAGASWHSSTSVMDGGSATSINRVFDVVWNASASKFFGLMRYHGIYQSTDGQNWTRMTNQPGSGLTTAACPAATSTACPIYRGVLAVRPGANEMYVVWTSINSGTGADAFGGVARSLDASTWTTVTSTGLTTCGDPSGCAPQQGFYNQFITAVPNGSNTDVYIGFINVWRCTLANTGTSNLCNAASPSANRFNNLTHVYGGPGFGGTCSSSYQTIHPDEHAVAVVPTNAQIMYFGNDGGVYRSLTAQSGLTHGTCTATDSNPFSSINTSSLGSLSQFVSISQSPTDQTVILGGTQDNGSPGMATSDGQTSGTDWFEANGGDGGYNEIDQTNPVNWYTTNTDVSIQKCVGGTNAGPYNPADSCIKTDFFNSIVTSTTLGGDHGAFYTPYILDPADQTKIIVGTCRVWRGPNTSTGWPTSALSGDFEPAGSTPCSGGETNLVRSLAAGGTPVGGVSPVIYAGTDGFSGSNGGRIWVTTNANAATPTWTDTTGAINPGGFPISSVAIDRTVATGQTAYIAIMGFTGNANGAGHIFKTTNAGASWTDVGVGLPDAPADAIAIDPNSNQTIYVATDVGVFVTTNGGGAWQEYGTGLPNVAGLALRIFTSGGVQKLRVGTHGRGVWETDLVPSGPPTLVSVTPSSGTGTTQTFAALYSDSRGFANITQAYIEINGSNSLVGACAAYYDSTSNGVFLNLDNGSGWTGPITIGQAGSLQNSQCTLNAGASSVNGSSNNLTVNFALTFKSPFVGNKNVYLNATNQQALSAGWHLLGTWNPGTSVAPTAVSVTPNGGTGTTKTFALLYSDANGNADLGNLYAIINTAVSYPSSCSVNFNNTTGGLYIINDAGSSWGTPITIGTAGTLQNSQCSIAVGSSSVVRSGNNVTVNVAVTFKPAFTGSKSVFMKAVDHEGLASAWLNAGSWFSGASVAPTAVSVTPNGGAATSKTFAFLYSDGNGNADLGNVYAVINTTNTYVGACAINFNNGTKGLYIINDAGSSWGTPITIGTAGTLQNSQCSIAVGSSSVVRSGNNLTVNVAVTFKGTFTGSKGVFMKAVDREALASSWLSAGTWFPGASSAPSAVSVTPNSGSGSTQTFALLYSDPNGYGDLGNVYTVINTTNTYVGACGINFNNGTGGLYIINDAGTSWGAPITIGTAGTLQNSQCSINVGSSSVVRSGNNLTVNVAVTFKPAFTGGKSVFMKAVDREALGSSWLTAGSWTAP